MSEILYPYSFLATFRIQNCGKHMGWSLIAQLFEVHDLTQRRLNFRYSQEQLFNAVLAVDLYHGFVPWCQRSEVLKEYPDGSFDAELEIGFKFLVESYISHVEFERPKWIKVRTCFFFQLSVCWIWECNESYDMIWIRFLQTTARDTGLFDHLINLWQFKPGPIPGTCDLSILVDFKFNSPLYRQVKTTSQSLCTSFSLQEINKISLFMIETCKLLTIYRKIYGSFGHLKIETW